MNKLFTFFPAFFFWNNSRNNSTVHSQRAQRTATSLVFRTLETSITFVNKTDWTGAAVKQKGKLLSMYYFLSSMVYCYNSEFNLLDLSIILLILHRYLITMIKILILDILNLKI
jgi:hypothetical protein